MRKALIVALALAMGGTACVGLGAGAQAEDEVAQSPTVRPLRAARPAWFTPELEAKLAAPAATTPAPADAPLPGEVGIRPGSWMISPYLCTMNFIFRSGSTLAIGTAGHCTNTIGQDVTLLTLAPGGSDPVLVNVGKVLVRASAGVGNDFALVSIYPSLYGWVSPTIAAIGGPCGRYTGSATQVVAHYGHGLGIGTGGTPRAGVSTVWMNAWYEWAGVLSTGDSGSAVRVGNMKAAGNLTHVGVLVPGVPKPLGYGTRIAKILKIATGYALVNSPLCV